MLARCSAMAGAGRGSPPLLGFAAFAAARGRARRRRASWPVVRRPGAPGHATARLWGAHASGLVQADTHQDLSAGACERSGAWRRAVQRKRSAGRGCGRCAAPADVVQTATMRAAIDAHQKSRLRCVIWPVSARSTPSVVPNSASTPLSSTWSGPQTARAVRRRSQRSGL